MKISRFEDLEAYQVAREFTRKVGKLLRTQSFAKSLHLVAQIERALLSVVSNIAEGYKRDGRQEFVQFLSIAGTK
jgi:four helix bundle protein